MRDAAGLVELLKEISRETTCDNGIGACLEKESTQQMTVIMAGPYWCLDWFPEDYQSRGCVGSYHTVSGQADIQDGEAVLTFYMFGHHSECRVCDTVNEEEALEAIKEFLLTAEKPVCVKWDLD